MFRFPIKSNLPTLHAPPRLKHQQQQTTERQPRQQLSKTTTTNNYRKYDKQRQQHQTTTTNVNEQWIINNQQSTINKQQSTKPRTTNGDGHPTITNAIEQDGTAKFNDCPSMQINVLASSAVEHTRGVSSRELHTSSLSTVSRRRRSKFPRNSGSRMRTRRGYPRPGWNW